MEGEKEGGRGGRKEGRKRVRGREGGRERRTGMMKGGRGEVKGNYLDNGEIAIC